MSKYYEEIVRDTKGVIEKKNKKRIKRLGVEEYPNPSEAVESIVEMIQKDNKWMGLRIRYEIGSDMSALGQRFSNYLGGFGILTIIYEILAVHDYVPKLPIHPKYVFASGTVACTAAAAITSVNLKGLLWKNKVIEDCLDKLVHKDNN